MSYQLDHITETPIWIVNWINKVFDTVNPINIIEWVYIDWELYTDYNWNWSTITLTDAPTSEIFIIYYKK
jgi:hypothetical protein